MKLNITIALFFVTNLFGVNFEFEGDIQFNKPYLFVSLGCTCWQAQALRLIKAHSLRDAAFPFDWLLSLNNDGLVKCLNEDFEHFLDESCFVRYGGSNLENTRYNFKFTHEWPFRKPNTMEDYYIKQMSYIKEKYTRRINRFRNLKHYKGKIFFVRCFQTDPTFKGEPGWNTQNAHNLKNALQRFFPESDFTLVVVSCTENDVPEIESIEGVKEYKITNLTADGFLSYTAMYKDLLSEFALNSH